MSDLQENIFVNNALIRTYVKDSMKQKQKSGNMGGRKGRFFNPLGTGTRAAGLAVFYRFVELTASVGTMLQNIIRACSLKRRVALFFNQVAGWKRKLQKKYTFNSHAFCIHWGWGRP